MPTTTELFTEHRRLLFSVAYRMLGSVADAEDAVQDSWLRWSAVDPSAVDHPKAYLVKVVTTTALNRLRAARARRESYLGPWLPEPLPTGPDVAEEAEMAESVSLAMLVVLETLSPDERAVFVLREVFGHPHAEIAEALGKPEATVRQLAHRARSHVQARRPRFETDRARQREATDRFLAATLDGDVESLMAVLAPDVTLITDGGGRITAARNPVSGADKVARFLLGVSSRPWHGVDLSELRYAEAELNGAPALIVYLHGTPVATVAVEVADGRITAVRMVANPEKLGHLPEREDLA
ncbi:MAG TPA: RNA polymerase sigma-70 factor [Phytomonospora sp.]